MSRHKSKAIPGRNLRLADQIQKDLAGIVQREIDSRRAGLITISGVDLSADYAHAKVYFTVLGAEPDAAGSLLNEKAGWLHSLLFKLLHIHTVPTLRFYHDPHVAQGIEMSQLIDRARAGDVAANEAAGGGEASGQAKHGTEPEELPSAVPDEPEDRS